MPESPRRNWGGEVAGDVRLAEIAGRVEHLDIDVRSRIRLKDAAADQSGHEHLAAISADMGRLDGSRD